MKTVPMSEAGLRALLARGEAFLGLWGIIDSPLHPHGRDVAEACREARDRLGMPPRSLRAAEAQEATQA